MNDNLNVNIERMKWVGGQILPSIARKYAEANGELSDAADPGDMDPGIKPIWQQLQALLSKSLGENVNNMYDAGKAILMAAGDFRDTDNVNAKELLDAADMDLPIDPKPKADLIHGRGNVYGD